MLMFTPPAKADALDHWVWRNPAPFASWLGSVCFGGDCFVAVGDGGIVHTSADGLSWDEGKRIGTNTLNGVAHAGGQFIAVGDNGTILTSPDALAWTSRNSGTSSPLLAVTYGNGRFVACGKAGQLAVSTDGTSWIPATITSNDLSSISFGNGVFVILETVPNGYSSSLTYRLLVSTDAQTWMSTLTLVVGDVLPSKIQGVAFGNGMFVASASVEIRDPLGPPGTPDVSLCFGGCTGG
jgi:hypothetical protein